MTYAPVELPPLEDCAAARAVLLGSRLLLLSDTPSERADGGTDKNQAYGRAWHWLSLDHPERGWSLLGRNRTIYDGTLGVQDVCILNHGFALLSGDYTYPGEIDPLKWNVSFVPTDSVQATWSAAAARIAPPNTGPPTQLACNGNAIYARYANGDRMLSPHPPAAQIVRLTLRP